MARFSFGFKKNWPEDDGTRDIEQVDEQIKGLSNLYIPEEKLQQVSAVADILDVLQQQDKIDQSQYEQIRHKQQSSPGGQIEQIIQQSGFVSDEDILAAKAQVYGMEFRKISPEQVDKNLFEKLNLTLDFIRDNGICPVKVENNVLIVATSDPANIFAIEDVKRQTSMEVQVVVCCASDIKNMCEVLHEETIDYDVDDIMSDMTDVEVVEDVQKDFEDLERMAGQSPIIKYVNYLISNAINTGASDIHIEPRDKSTRIRYRIDGVLFETLQCPTKMHPAVVSRIKIMSNLDISERRLPQDGKISVLVGGRAIDLRVSILPTNRGEKVVIRILDSKSILRGLEELGMEGDTLAEFRKQIVVPNGIFLVTGPTGSGKSTTLYSAISQMDGEKLNISTVEDPVEYELDFCSQVHVKEHIGLSFASALRSLLRQDPDIIMIGEIRDQETAKIAVQAALTGHLVFSTLHTNDAASSITRLVDIGIDEYLIAASLNGILAQRLVRRICPHCKEPYHVPDNIRANIEQAGIDPNQLQHGTGCENCRQSGYIGRVGIYEMLIIDDAFREMINSDCSVAAMRRLFREKGNKTLYIDGLRKVAAGMTTIDEVLRVTEISTDEPE
ncbi:MAG: type II/IV secretion system protein [Sedimentisphaerales bacterium]|nr:type II/IV secretion system protein [Sedimentisphaerales bacterium]